MLIAEMPGAVAPVTGVTHSSRLAFALVIRNTSARVFVSLSPGRAYEPSSQGSAQTSRPCPGNSSTGD